MAKFVEIIRKSGDSGKFIEHELERLRRGLASSAFVAESSAKQDAPVDTGFLRNSIFNKELDPFRYLIGAHAEYSTFVVRGTIYQQPNDFMTPAIELARRHLKAYLKGR